MLFAFSKSMVFNFYFKENIQMKVRLVPVDDKYYVFVLFENIEDKVSLLEIHSKLNYSMMLIQSLSHEMFTPLHHVLGISDRLYKKLSDVGKNNTNFKMCTDAATKRLEMLDEVLIIKQIGQGLSIFVQNILDFANIVNNTFSLYTRRFKVIDLMEYLISIFSVKAKQKSIRLCYECDKSLEMNTDYNRLAGLLFNFMDNSIKFTHKGGITIHAHNIASRVVFRVVDTGMGIDEADIKKISQIFRDPFLADKTKASAGLGIGLRISLSLIKTLSKGDLAIDISSEKNVGTTIQFEICQGLEDDLQNGVSRKFLDPNMLLPSPSSRTLNHKIILEEEEDVKSLKALAFHKERKKLKSRFENESMCIISDESHKLSHSSVDDISANEGDSMNSKPVARVCSNVEDISMFDVNDAEVAKHIEKLNKTKLVSLNVKRLVSEGVESMPSLEEEFEFDEVEEKIKHPCKIQNNLRRHDNTGIQGRDPCYS